MYFLLIVLFVYCLVLSFCIKKQNELIDTIIKNTDFNLDNIENFIFGETEYVIRDLDEILDDPKQEFRKYRITTLRSRFIASVPVTYKANIQIVPNYKNLFDKYNKLILTDPEWSSCSCPKILVDHYKQTLKWSPIDYDWKPIDYPNPRIEVIGNSINNFTQCHINDKYSTYEIFSVDDIQTFNNEISVYFNDDKEIEIKMLANFNRHSYYEGSRNKYVFPFKLLINEFMDTFKFFDKESPFASYHGCVVKKFSDDTEKELKRYGVKYNIEETVDFSNSCCRKEWEEREKLSDLLSNLEIIKCKSGNYYETKNVELFNFSTDTHIFTHEFYTVYFSVGFYLNK